MTVLEFAPEVAQDLERIVEHLIGHNAGDIGYRIEALLRAFEVLASNPLIGRALPNGLRELVVGRDATGNVALYHHAPLIDTVFVLAVRSQREAGYRGR